MGTDQTQGYICRTCGLHHDEVSISYSTEAPALWYGIPEKDRKRRAQLSSDLCVIDGQHFFVLGNIGIPILDTDKVFSWSTWVSLSQANYDRMLHLRKTKGREKEPSYFCWLSTLLPSYPDIRGILWDSM